MIYYSAVTPKGNSSYSYNSQADADANAKYLDDHDTLDDTIETFYRALRTVC